MATRQPNINSSEQQYSQVQIDGLGERMDKGFSEMKDMLRTFDERVRNIENRDASLHPMIEARLESITRRVEKHELDLATLNDLLGKIARTSNQMEIIFRWLLGILATVIASVAITFLTGKIDIVVR